MAREGTRSQTGNSKPRVFEPIDTAPAIKRTTKPKAPKKTDAAAPKGAKPTGVTKKKAPAKEGAATKKVKSAAKKVEKAATKVKKDAKPKTVKKKEPVAAKDE